MSNPIWKWDLTFKNWEIVPTNIWHYGIVFTVMSNTYNGIMYRLLLLHFIFFSCLVREKTISIFQTDTVVILTILIGILSVHWTLVSLVFQQTTFWDIFHQKTGFDISCKLFPMETIGMKCQTLLSLRKRNINLSSAELAKRVVKVKCPCYRWTFRLTAKDFD